MIGDDGPVRLRLLLPPTIALLAFAVWLAWPGAEPPDVSPHDRSAAAEVLDAGSIDDPRVAPRRHAPPTESVVGRAEWGPVSGIVEEAESVEPRAGARVSLHVRTIAEDDESEVLAVASPPVVWAQTDSEGRFETAPVAPGAYWAMTAAEGCAGDVEPIEVAVGGLADVELAVWQRPEREFAVVDEWGREIGGGEVLVYEEDLEGPPWLTKSADADGHIRVRVGAGDHLLFRAPGFAPNVVTGLQVVPEVPPVDAQRVRLVPSYAISGRVVDGAGQPVAAARVDSNQRLVPVQRTDDKGRFRLHPVREHGVKTLQVSAAGFPVWTGSARGGDRDVVVRLGRGARIAGRVTHADGEDAFEASIVLRRDGDRLRVVHGGTFDFEDVLPGRYQLVAWIPERPARYSGPPPSQPMASDAYTGAVTLDVAEGASHEDVEITLAKSPRSWISLRLRAPDDTELSNLRAYGRLLLNDDEVGEAGDRLDVELLAAPGTETDLSAAAHVDGARVLVRGTFVTDSEAGVTVHAVALPRPSLLTVHLVGPDGQPLPEGVESSVRGRGQRTSRRDGSDGNHTHHVYVDRSRRAEIDAAASGYARATVRLDRERADTLTIALHPSVGVHGRIVGGTKELDGVQVWVRSDTPPASRGWTTRRVRPDGRFVVERTLAAGPATLRVYVRGRRAVERRVVLPAVVDHDLGRIELPPDATLRGSVSDGAGRPIGGVRIQLFADTDIAGGSVSHPDGSFAADVPSDFSGWLLARRNGYGAAIRRVDRASLGRAHHVELGVAGSVRLRIDFDGVDDFDGRVAVRTVAGGHVWEPSTAEQADSEPFDRVVVLDGLPTGPLEIGYIGPDAEMVRRVTVRAGERVDVDLGPGDVVTK